MTCEICGQPSIWLTEGTITFTNGLRLEPRRRWCSDCAYRLAALIATTCAPSDSPRYTPPTTDEEPQPRS